VIVRVNRGLTPDWSARKLATAIGDHLVHIHIELRPAPRHPNMQREHILMLSGENLIADLDNQLVLLVVKPSACVVCIGGSLLQNGV
jgi:hypothetical protein